MKKISFFIISVITSVFLISGCSGSPKATFDKEEKNAATGSSSWSVYIYMCGSDLESGGNYASDALSEMIGFDYPENINVIVETGGSSQWAVDGIYPDYIQRWEMQKNGMFLADQKNTENMGSSSTLSDFLSWGTATYPADNNIVIIWNHGGASTDGVAYDELNGFDSLNIDELSYAVASSGVNFDIIGFDACMMSSLENAVALAPYANYLVASEEYMLAGGLDYNTLINSLINYPQASPMEIGQVICDSYYTKCEENGTEETAEIALTDLSKISTLSQAFDGMAGVMLTETDGLKNLGNLIRNIEKSQIFGANTPEEGFSNTVDLGDMANKITENIGQTAEIVKQMLSETVVYQKAGSKRAFSSGLSVFYPLNPNEAKLEAYLNSSTSNNYTHFLKNICINKVSLDEDDSEDFRSSWAYHDFTRENSQFNYWTLVNNEQRYELNMQGCMDIIKNVKLNLYYTDEESGQNLLLYSGEDTEFDWDGGIFKDSGENSLFTLNGKKVCTYLTEQNDSYSLYSIPILLNGVRTNIRAGRTADEDGKVKYEVYGTWDGVDYSVGMSNRNVRKIKCGDKITPLFEIYGSTGSGNVVEGKQFTVGLGGIKFEKKDLSDGKYTTEFQINDIYGGVRFADSATKEISGNNISVY